MSGRAGENPCAVEAVEGDATRFECGLVQRGAQNLLPILLDHGEGVFFFSNLVGENVAVGEVPRRGCGILRLLTRGIYTQGGPRIYPLLQSLVPARRQLLLAGMGVFFSCTFPSGFSGTSYFCLRLC